MKCEITKLQQQVDSRVRQLVSLFPEVLGNNDAPERLAIALLALTKKQKQEAKAAGVYFAA